MDKLSLTTMPCMLWKLNNIKFKEYSHSAYVRMFFITPIPWRAYINTEHKTVKTNKQTKKVQLSTKHELQNPGINKN